MKNKTLNYLVFKDEEMSIRVSPEIVDGVWTGNINLSVDSFDHSPLNDMDYFSLMNFVRMIMAVPVLMEEDADAREKLYNILEKEIDPPKKNGKIIGRKDNIITINFNSKTDGSA
tara:strand:- start:285 stop:629 length:345 start_codon:yes stop_codon:yes gene_type:complete